ncbi:hypothetical protein BJF78_31740 [Pseudonocardia sp. CNS-139]|nr:hypothetical protein BJF78_31740 [Pseudonocardia sp. CNS-139]
MDAVWQSFEADGTLATVITNQRALWTRSLQESQRLRDRYSAYRAAFGTDIMRAAGIYLDENRKLTQQKAKEVGVDLGGEGEVASPEMAQARLDEVRKAAVVVSQLDGLLAELRRIPVGYRNTVELQQKLVDNATTDARRSARSRTRPRRSCAPTGRPSSSTRTPGPASRPPARTGWR